MVPAAAIAHGDLGTGVLLSVLRRSDQMKRTKSNITPGTLYQCFCRVESLHDSPMFPEDLDHVGILNRTKTLSAHFLRHVKFLPHIFILFSLLFLSDYINY